MSFELPETVGPQEVPVELFDGRVEDEPLDKYRERREHNQGIVDQYLTGIRIDKQPPSTRILRRLSQDKRTLSGLSAEERRYIRHVLDIPDITLKLFVAFYQAEEIRAVYPSEVHDFESAPAVQNVNIGNRNYGWL